LLVKSEVKRKMTREETGRKGGKKWLEEKVHNFTGILGWKAAKKWLRSGVLNFIGK